MMPLLYAIVKSTQGNLNEAQKSIHEGMQICKITSLEQTSACKSGSVSPLTNNNGNERILFLCKRKIYRKEEPSKKFFSKIQLHRPWKQEY